MDRPQLHHDASDRCDPALIAILRRQTAHQKLATLDAMWRSARTFVCANNPLFHRRRVVLGPIVFTP